MKTTWQVFNEEVAEGDEELFSSIGHLLSQPRKTLTSDNLSGVSLLKAQANYYVKVFHGAGNRLQHMWAAAGFSENCAISTISAA